MVKACDSRPLLSVEEFNVRGNGVRKFYSYPSEGRLEEVKGTRHDLCRLSKCHTLKTLANVSHFKGLVISNK